MGAGTKGLHAMGKVSRHVNVTRACWSLGDLSIRIVLDASYWFALSTMGR